MLESCFRTDMVVEITMQPVRRHGVDAAIFFSDIVVPLKAIGVDLDIVPGTGPVVAEPIRSADAAGAAAARPRARRRPVRSPTPSAGSCRRARDDAADRLRRRAVHAGVLPRRGWPVARPPPHQGAHVLRPGTCGTRCSAVSRRSRRQFLRLQVEAGASAVQLFDSWAGSLSRERLRDVRQAALEAVLDAVADLDVPRIHFGVGTGELLRAMGDAGADVVGVDWRVPLDEAVGRVGPAGRAGQPRPDRPVRSAPRSSTPGRRGHRRRPQRATGTCSTSATACCRPPTPTR